MFFHNIQKADVIELHQPFDLFFQVRYLYTLSTTILFMKGTSFFLKPVEIPG